ncbi:heme peroxidase 2-like [Paramacrobiotus metropolitanus]|uniref:heme peroxidase 2-like n=1 Tax=Paramacrobiotus metropolitanus TaxID=2943436 RepID=UPI002445C158|nr:heme peroxidase 2-like [Paramacrobiotus metropolitanus]
MGRFAVAVVASVAALCSAQPYQKAPYGNYTGGASMYGNYSGQPSYPAAPYNSSYGPKYMNNTYQANYYQTPPWAYNWDHEHQSRHLYSQEAAAWLYANIYPAWEWAVGQYATVNGRYYNNAQKCGYSGNPYNSVETRNAQRAEYLTLMAQWLWDNYPGDKSVLHKAMLNLDAYKIQLPFIQDCLAENYNQWQGQCGAYQRYNRPDQICNNIGYPTWGAWLDVTIRITDIWNYYGGIWQANQYNVWPDYNGQITPLADAKYMANALDNWQNGQCYNLDATMLHAYFTQFIAHDITRSGPYTVTGYNGIQVKPECCKISDECLHHTCHSWYGQYSDGYNQYPVCEELSDNLPGIDYCNPIPKDSVNLQTSYIDMSAVYGASCYEAAKVRAWRKGKLRVNKGKYGLYSKNVLLPDDYSPNPDECDISYPDGDLKCHLAGDPRNSMHPGLYVLHTLFMRMHNRFASSCAKWLEKYYLPEDVLDEICYQETRRLMQAIGQKIFYAEHLPVELGPYVANDPNYGLSLDYVLPYDPAVHASVWPEYLYAAGRLHSTISHWAQVVAPEKAAQGLQEPDNWYGIYDFFHRGYALMSSKHKLNELVANSLYDPEQCYDALIVPEMRNKVPSYGGPGMDMHWVNQMRGREWGLPWYSQVRDWCGMSYINDWADLQNIWSENCLKTLPGIVYHPKNVEAWVGMICEKPMPGAVVGPTAGCVLQRQYYNLREGDRFFFDRNGFTPDQINVIKKFNMGKVLCITTNLDYVTTNPFRTPNAYSNPYQSCNAYDDITEDDLAMYWSTIPYAAGDYRTCKDYSQFAPNQQYQNTTYNAYANRQYGNYSQQYQPPAPQYQQTTYQQTTYQKSY